MRSLTHADWIREATTLFGSNPKKWRFVCPVCKHVASTQDWLDAKAQDAVAFSCIGRWRPNAPDAFPLTRKKGAPKTIQGHGPCNYAGGGLFKLNPVEVLFPDGSKSCCFEFDRGPSNQVEPAEQFRQEYLGSFEPSKDATLPNQPPIPHPNQTHEEDQTQKAD